MFCLSKPTRAAIDAFLAKQSESEFSYPEVGLTCQDAPQGYTVDRNRVRLGYSLDVFERGKAAIRQWKMFDMPWSNLCWPTAGVEAGVNVVVVLSHFGFWSMNPARIVYVMNDVEGTRRFGFAYGTLRDHAEIGEERFLVEFDPVDQAVYYDILAFSRPGLWARLGYPLARGLQKRFVSDSKSAMVRAVS
jgi:uncharacterized protein (UPF0548 family)